MRLIMFKGAQIKDEKITTSYYLSLIVIVSIIIVGLQYVFNVPLKMGIYTDVYAHLAYIREVSKNWFYPGSAFTAINIPDLHYGPYIVILGYIYTLTRISPIILLYLSGLINLCLFILFSFKFIKELLDERIAVFSVFAMLFFWGSSPVRYAGIYSIADGYNFFSTQGIAYTLFYASLYFLLKAKSNKKYIWYTLIFSFLLLTTHILMGLFYFMIVYLFLLSNLNFLSNKKLNSYNFFLVSIPLITILLSLLWPYYSLGQKIYIYLINPTFNSNVIGSFRLLTSIKHNFIAIIRTDFGYPLLGGIASVGIIGLLDLARKKQFFLPAWFFVSLIITLSGFFQFNERIFFFSMIPLHIGWGVLIEKLSREIRIIKIFIGLILIISSLFVVSYRVVNSVKGDPLNFDFIEINTEEDVIILTDITTGRAIPGLTGRKTVGRYHPPPLSVYKEQTEATNIFFNESTINNERIGIIKQYNVSYVLVNKRLLNLHLPFILKYENEEYKLYDTSGF